MDRESVTQLRDGVHAMVPGEAMCESARKLRYTYARKPGAPLIRREFGHMHVQRWKDKIAAAGVPLEELFHYDPPGSVSLGELGWCVPALMPAFEEKVIEDRGDHELVEDAAGRRVLYLKGCWDGCMPQFLDHPVKDWKTWEEDIRWRLDPKTPERYEGVETRMENVRSEAGRGMMVTQQVIGGYMYLRVLFGPTEVLYAFHDSPDLIHDCMQVWLELADAVTAVHQQHVTIDELFLAEDICFNHGPLISPDMMREFLLPYYRRLVANIRSRQIDQSRHLYVEIDTDGDVRPVIPLYMDIGMDAMRPFEVASGCDVVRIGREYPDLVILGGIDKRVLAAGKEAIDRHVEYILPAMRERGGYIPTCDHGVPANVTYEDYLHYRRRAVELGG